MLTGRVAFGRGTGADTMAAILKDEPEASIAADVRRRSRASSRAVWRNHAKRDFNRRAISRSRWTS